AGRGVSLQWLGVRRCLHSFPTRRSSDLEAVRADTLDLARLESALGCHGLKVSEIGVRQGNGHPRGSQPRGSHRPAIAGLARGGSNEGWQPAAGRVDSPSPFDPNATKSALASTTTHDRIVATGAEAPEQRTP